MPTINPVNPTTTSKNLGLTAAIVATTTAPSNQNILWLDTTQNPNVKKYYDFGSNQWLPLIQNDNTNPGNSVSINVGQQTIFVSVNGNDFTGIVGDLTKPFNTIVGAYAAAKTLTPSSQNKITIVVFPGKYVDDLTADTDYISIVSAITQETIYNESLINTYTSYTSMRRRCICDAILTVTCKNLVIKGIDVKTLTLKSFPYSDTVLAKNSFDNMICGTINNNTFGNQFSASFFDVQADNFLPSDASTDLINSSFIMCGSLSFRAGISTPIGSTWIGALRNSFFSKCWGGTGSFAGNGGYAYQTSFYKCVGTNNCFGTIEACTLDTVVFGNSCVYVMNGGKIQDSTGGNDCVKDFTNTAVIKDCDFGNDFGRNGSLTYVWGNIDNVRSNYLNGFCNGRNWWGKMRRMFIRTSTPGGSGLNVYSPNGFQPATIESSTILSCFDDSTAPVIGTIAYVSYCKFNREISVGNALGSDAAAYNIVNSNLCNYVANVCTIPTSFLVTSSGLVTGGAITFTFSYQMSSTRAGSQIQMTDPTGQVTLINFVGNDGGMTTGTLSVLVAVPVAGMYSFKLHTVCAYDMSGSATEVSSWTPTVTEGVTNPVVRAKAWRKQISSNFCVISNLSPQPLYAKIQLRNSQTLNTYFPAPGTGNFYDHTQTITSDLYVMFYTDAGLTSPATLSNQTFIVYVRKAATQVNYAYTGTNTFPTTTTNAYNEAVEVYALSSVSGTEYLLATGITTSTYSEETNDHTTSGTFRTLGTESDAYTIFPTSTIVIGRTGQQGWNTLEQYYTDDSSLTGLTKVNSSSDTNYVAPVTDLTDCAPVTPSTQIGYGLSLIVKKLQLITGSNTVIPSHSVPQDTGGGGETFQVQRFIGLPTQLIITVDSYYGGIVTSPGNVEVTVVSDAGSHTYNVPKNVQTTVGTFVNITSINASNF